MLSRLSRSIFSSQAWKRGFASLEDSDRAFFNNLLHDGGMLTESDVMEPFMSDWMNHFQAKRPSVVLRPKTTEAVASILRHCNDRGIGVVPQGGNTGLVGGSVPVDDELVLCLSGMNKILEFDDKSGVLVAEAGCILEEVDNYLSDRGYIFPLDLGAKGTCHIGGTVATNAGGLRLCRYGSLHGSVLGMEVVLADGTVVDMLNTLRKDNTGYDLKQLFIGAEGTLGVITKLAIQTAKRPQHTNVALFGIESYANVLDTFVAVKDGLGEILSAIEFFDRSCLDIQIERLGKPDPMGDAYPFYMVVETGGSNAEHDMEKLSDFLEKTMGTLVADGVLAQDNTQVTELWSLREDITVALKQEGYTYKYDLSIALPQLYQLVEDAKTMLAGKARVYGYGHLGDANVHLNVQTDSFNEEVHDMLEPWVYDYVGERGGSVSAEHGVGLMKVEPMRRWKSPAALMLMRSIKKLLDPNCILNPGKVLEGEREGERGSK